MYIYSHNCTFKPINSAFGTQIKEKKRKINKRKGGGGGVRAHAHERTRMRENRHRPTAKNLKKILQKE